MSADEARVGTPTTTATGRGLGASRVLRSLWRDKPALLGAMFLVVVVVAAVFAPLIAPSSPSDVDVISRLLPPFWQHGGSTAHLLGTDGLGRDMLSRLIYGARLSLYIGVSVTLIAGAIGTMLGLLAGYKGGLADKIIMRLADAQMAFPGLLLVLLVLAILGPSALVIIGVLALYGWMVFARQVRGAVLQLRQSPAIVAADMVGCSTPRILVRHLLPNLYSLLLTQGMLELARVILAESSLSFLGLGIQPPSASWGLMVAENRSFITEAWWTVALPGVALIITVLAVNLLANWLRLETDPQQRQRRLPHDFRRLQRAAAAVRGARVKAPRAPDAESLLSVSDLDVRFFTESGVVDAVSGASLEIRPGETVGIVGESGSGKSTAALALIDLVPPPGAVTFDSLRWQGEEITTRDLRKLRGSEITMIFQDPMTSLNPLMPVGRQVAEALIKHKGMTKTQARARAKELFGLVGIPSPDERLDQYPHELSGGMRQRVMIACALAPEPKLIIADEPTTALDATIQAQILELIANLQERLGIALLLITHDLGVVARTCDRVVVMYGGRVVEISPIHGLFEHPQHRYTEALIDAVPHTQSSREELTTIPGYPPSRYDARPGCPFAPRCAHATDTCSTLPQTVHIGDERAYACWHPVGVEVSR